MCFRYYCMVALSCFVLLQCRDKEEDIKATSDKEFQDYLVKQNITTPPTTEGLYYIETTAGTGIQPLSGDFVMLNLTGRLLSGKVTETNDSILAHESAITSACRVQYPVKCRVDSLSFDGLIIGVKMMKEGGKAKMVIPYSLAFGMYSINGLPYYANFVYDVELVKVIKDPAQEDNTAFEHWLDSLGYAYSGTHDTLYYTALTVGSGISPANGDPVAIEYTIKLMDCTIIDKVTKATEFIVGESFDGMNKGLKKMKQGGRAQFIVHRDFAFGSKGYSNAFYNYYWQQYIPPYSSLFIDVFMADVIPAVY